MTSASPAASDPGSRPGFGRRIAPWTPLIVSAALGIGAIRLEAIDPRGSTPSDPWLVPILLASAVVAGLIGRRQPRNAVAWLLGLLSLSMIASFFIWRYAIAGSDGVLALPGADLAGAFSWTWILALACPVVIAFVVPTGRPASPRWARVLAVTVATLTVVIVGFAFGNPDFQVGQSGAGDQVLPNPIYVPALRPLYEFASAAYVLYLALFGAGAAALVARFRQAHGTERQQLKWIASGIVLMLISMASSNVLPSPFSDVVFAVAMLALPASLGIAILRYRLYDIDRIISRTVSYAVLSAVLAAVYVAGFLGLQAVLSSVTEREGPIAVAASTLVVFVLFAPFRRRIQNVVDRRFNRGRYDAEREVEAFAGTVRDEVEVERVAEALAATLQRTMQPASASIWLRTREVR